MNKNIRICLIGATVKEESEGSIKLIAEACSNLGVELTNIPKGSLNLSINEDGIKVISPIKLEDQNIFIFRDIFNLVDGKTKAKHKIIDDVKILAGYLKNNLNKTICDEYLLMNNANAYKFEQNYKLWEKGINIIPTFLFMKTKDVIKNLDLFPYPIIIKPNNGARGENIFKFENKEEFKDFLMNQYNSSIFYPNLIQKFIPNNGDFRIVVLGDKVVAGVQKIRKAENVSANMSQGNEAIGLKDIPQDLQDLAIKAAKAVGIEFAGIDIIKNIETGEYHILEVNLSPQIVLTSQFSNTNIAEEFIKYLIEKAGLSI